MGTIMRYEEPLYLDPRFPILFHDDYLNASRRSVYTNWHPSVELLGCTGGRGRVLIDGENIFFGQGEVAVINPNAIHTIHAMSDACYYDCLTVDARFLQAQGFELEGTSFNGAVSGEVSETFQRIREEFHAENPCYKQAVLSLVMMLFCQLYRTGAARVGKHEGNALKHQQTIAMALSYIRQHLCERITVDMLCQEVGISKYYFCRLFRTYTGLSVVEYINAIRCEQARKLLLEEGYNISQAADYLGIENLSYFSRLYKKHIGAPPSKDKMSASSRRARGMEYGIRDSLHIFEAGQ